MQGNKTKQNKQIKKKNTLFTYEYDLLVKSLGKEDEVMIFYLNESLWIAGMQSSLRPQIEVIIRLHG